MEQKFTNCELEAEVSREKGKEFETLTSKVEFEKGNWMVLFFWPKDFTLVCPTEVKSFNEKISEFRDRDATLLGAYTDTAYDLLAWRNNHEDLKALKFPKLSDHARKLTSELGILVVPKGAMRCVNVMTWMSGATSMKPF